MARSKVYHVPRWLLLGNDGAGWLPNISLIASDLKGPEKIRVINNELIHQLQQDEVGYLKWICMYLRFHFRYGYESNPFERDSRRWDTEIENRPPEFWREFIL